MLSNRCFMKNPSAKPTDSEIIRSSEPKKSQLQVSRAGIIYVSTSDLGAFFFLGGLRDEYDEMIWNDESLQIILGPIEPIVFDMFLMDFGRIPLELTIWVLHSRPKLNPGTAISRKNESQPSKDTSHIYDTVRQPKISLRCLCFAWPNHAPDGPVEEEPWGSITSSVLVFVGAWRNARHHKHGTRCSSATQ